MAYKSLDDQKAASRRHYEANKKRYLERNTRYREMIRSQIQSVKEATPCADCGKSYPYYVMDFDHLGIEAKENTINYLMSTGRIRKAKDEIRKCEVVCANCHRYRTHRRAHKASMHP